MLAETKSNWEQQKHQDF